jgi:predicted ester cyclase
MAGNAKKNLNENKAIVRRFIEEGMNKGNMKVTDDQVDTNYVEHNPFPGQAPGLSGLKQRIITLRDAFPDLLYTIEDIIAEEDRVVIRWTFRATYKGVFLDIPPTGKPLIASGIDIYRLAGVRIAAHWHSIMKIASVAQSFFPEITG